jgi:hypothetical protein
MFSFVTEYIDLKKLMQKKFIIIVGKYSIRSQIVVAVGFLIMFNYLFYSKYLFKYIKL